MENLNQPIQKIQQPAIKPRKLKFILPVVTIVIITTIIISYFMFFNQQTENLGTKDSTELPSIISNYQGKKILFINSYHREYGWSDGIESGIKNTLPLELTLETIEMDTKRNVEENFKQQAAIKVKEKIESFNPDVVIACDDNAFKYVVKEYYKDADLPFVFCGVNWDLSAYQGPYSNTAGMIEIALIKQIEEYMQRYAKGNLVGFLTGDVLSEHKNAEYWARELGRDFEKIEYVKNFEEWKTKYLELQESVDMLFIGSSAGIKDWDDEKAIAFVLENTKIPTGCELDIMMPVSLIGLTKVAEEQGEWSAEAALQILNGKTPSEIGTTTNKKGNLMLNLKIAEKLGIVFTPSMLKNAEIIE